MSTPNTSSENIGWRLEVFVGIFIPLQVLFVVLRFYARSLAALPWGWDDGLIIAALLGQFVASGIAIGSVKQGAVGHHTAYVTQKDPESVVVFLKYLVVIPAWYLSTVWISKLAICILFRRIFPQKPVKIILTAVGAVLVCNSIACLIADLAACRPFSAHWAPREERAARCLDKEALFIWSTLPNILTDVVLLILPLPIIWRLHTSTQMKAALTVTFSIGSSGLVASILRFWAFSRTRRSTDFTYHAVELIIWTLVEPGIYLISACLLVFRPLLDKFSRNSFRMSIKPGSGGYDQHPDKDGDQPSRQISHEADIALGANINQGFKRLADDYSYEPTHQHRHSQFPKIRVTTDIEQSWDRA